LRKARVTRESSGPATWAITGGYPGVEVGGPIIKSSAKGASPFG